MYDLDSNGVWPTTEFVRVCEFHRSENRDWYWSQRKQIFQNGYFIFIHGRRLFKGVFSTWIAQLSCWVSPTWDVHKENRDYLEFINCHWYRVHCHKSWTWTFYDVTPKLDKRRKNKVLRVSYKYHMQKIFWISISSLQIFKIAKVIEFDVCSICILNGRPWLAKLSV